MKLHEAVSERYGCKFPARLNEPAIAYYREHSWNTRCLFIFDYMLERGDFTLIRDDLRYMTEEATEVWAELLEAFLYAACEDVRKNGRKPRGLAVNLEDED